MHYLKTRKMTELFKGLSENLQHVFFFLFAEKRIIVRFKESRWLLT